MRPFVPLSLAVALAALLPAQGVGFLTHGAYGDFAAEDAKVALNFIAPGTPITSAKTIQAVQGNAGAKTQLNPSPTGIVILETGSCVRLTDGKSAVGTTTSTSTSNVVRGPHALLMKLGGNGGATGKLIVAFAGTADRAAHGRARVDIGNNGSDEFDAHLPSAPIVKEFPIRSHQPLLIRISTEAGAEQVGAGRTGYGMSLKVVFEGTEDDDPCVATPFGSSCGSKLTVSDEVSGMLHKVTFDISGALPRAFGVLHIGMSPVRLEIPGTKCLIYTLPVLAIPHPTDANGNASRVLFAKGPLAGVVYAQAASVILNANPKLETSHGVKIDCGD